MPITIYNTEDPFNVKYKGNISLNVFNKTIPHNAWVNGNLLWASYYSEGVAVWDISEPEKPVLVAQVDTSPRFFRGFHGVWGIYPKKNNQIAYASDIEEGLFVLRHTAPIVNHSSGVDNKPNKHDSKPTETKHEASLATGASAAVAVFLLGSALAGAACSVRALAAGNSESQA